MIKSLLLKLGMLSMTIGVVIWVRWAPYPTVQDIPPGIENPIVASQATELEARGNRTAGSSDRNVQGPSMKAVAQREPSKAAIHSRLDLNHASTHELESLPGIGAVMAQRVVAFRTSVGGFRTVEDLREVKGIGAKTFDRLKPLVAVSTEKF
ncbi:MAG: helix-hairpin-helix domain-containing protein [Nitrospira sp.]|nr:helix-hairpin-helix domain-containing protein [Nitrospira sp.]